MVRFSFVDPTLSVCRESRWRFRFSVAGTVLCLLLISWGGFVTSMDAGLAVPDWPSSFGSYDPITTGFNDPANPTSRWWDHAPILAEHGHRLLGALLGLWIVVLALWTWRQESRRWMHVLGFGALGLVIVQGILGGLRVLWVSLDLAVVHALGAQLTFSLLLAMTLFTSQGWLRAENVPQEGADTNRLGQLGVITAIALYVQILLGAMLRHPGGGVHIGFAVIHIVGAIVVLGLIFVTWSGIRRNFPSNRLLNRIGWGMIGGVGLQLVLGFLAFVVLLFETRLAERSTTQLVLNSCHLVVGTLLLGMAVCLMVSLLRKPAHVR